MSQFLVVTAMGTDRSGIVYELADLTSSCDCDIIDSRVAIFGNEFTLIMLVRGEYSDITRLEQELPVQAAQRDLMTICKRTSKHATREFVARLVVKFEGEDKRGTMRRITQFLADRQLSLSGFSSHADSNDDGIDSQQLEVRIAVTAENDIDELEQSLQKLSANIGLSCDITRLEAH